MEGILALHWPGLRALWDTWDTAAFLHVDEATALARRTARDVRLRARSPGSVRRQWEATVWPMYRRYVERTRRFADVILDGAAPLETSAAALLAQVRRRREPPCQESAP